MSFLVQVLLFSLCLNRVIQIHMFDSKTCENSKYTFTFYIPLNDGFACTPAGTYQTYEKWTYDDVLKTLELTFFSDFDCQTPVEKAKMYYNFIDCYDNLGWPNFSQNFSLVDDFPFDIDEVKGLWTETIRYKDRSCQEPIDFMTNEDDMSQRLVLSLGTEKASHLLGYSTFCSPVNDKFYIEKYVNEAGHIQGIVYYPDAANKCNIHFAVEQFKEAPTFDFSFEMNCLTNTTVNERYEDLMTGSIVSKDDAVTETVKYFFDEGCKKEAYKKEKKSLGECASYEVVSSKYIDTDDKKYMIIYWDDECNSEEIGMLIIGWNSTFDNQTETFYEKCVSFKTDKFVSGEVNHFRKIVLTEKSCYSIGQLASFYTADYACGDDISKIQKDPQLVKLTYYDQDHCIPDFGSYKSIRGFCDDGKINATEFLDTDFCYGEDRDISVASTVQSICYKVHPNSPIYRHLTCIPFYCGIHSEFDGKKVCNGHGKCIGKNECDCAKGYANSPTGEFCDSWVCAGYEKSDGRTCNGHGECTDVENCSCDTGYSGEFCEKADWVWILGVCLGVFLPLICVVVFCCFFCLFGCCCLFVMIIFCAFLIGACIVWICFGVCCIAVVQWRRIMKFRQLDDFELLLQEQLLDKDVSMAHLKINKKLFEIQYDEIKIIEIIGSGGSDALVFLANWRGTRVAFKCFKTKKLCSSQDSFDSFEAEVNLLANVNHPNVIRFFGATLKPPRVGIIMEYCENGELLKFLAKYRTNNNKGYEMEQKFRLCNEVVSSVEYIHSRKILHRDIKPENVLIDGREASKLMDFGISRMMNEIDSKNGLTRNIGTSVFMAPEVVAGNYSFQCDSFSFSILMYCIFTEKQMPYDSSEYGLEVKVAQNPDFRPNIDDLEVSLKHDFGEEKLLGEEEIRTGIDWVMDVVVKCWNHDPEKRYTFKKLAELFGGRKFRKDDEETPRDDSLKGEEDGLSNFQFEVDGGDMAQTQDE